MVIGLLEVCRLVACRTVTRGRDANNRLEFLDHAVEFFSLSAKLFRGRSRFFRVGRVGLGDLIHLVDRSADLLQTLRLLVACRGDFANKIIDLPVPFRDFIQSFGNFLRDSDSIVGVLHRVGDHVRGASSGLGTSLGQVANLFGDYREPLAGLASSGRFDRRVECKQICLERDFVDRLDDLGRLVRRLLDLVDRRRHTIHRVGALLGTVPSDLGQRLRLGGVVRVLAGHRRHLFHAGGGLFKRRGLFRGTLSQRLAGRRNLTGSRRRLLRSGSEHRGNSDNRASDRTNKGERDNST